uniref:Cathepsin-like protein 1 n=1 Tax=Tigriopus japonicus TaxID=158387 RepID=A0A0H4K825_TIGJA|nr:cathepsin-like protein 1 [Tigriopus japonicus]
MKLALILLPVLALASASPQNAGCRNCETIDEFAMEFGDIVIDEDEKAKRAKALMDNEDAIRKHNEEFRHGDSNYYMKLNPLSDLPADEEEEQKLGLINVPVDEFSRGAYPLPLDSYDRSSESLLAQVRQNVQAPSAFFVDDNLRTPVKNQQQCGSCAAFATVAAVETCMLKSGANLQGLDLSEQSLLDCAYNPSNYANGCHGASIGAYSTFLASNLDGKLPHELVDPYLNTNPRLQCPNEPSFNTGAKVTQKIVSYGCDEATMEKLIVQYGMVITSLFAGNHTETAVQSGFSNYGGGVFDGCPSKFSSRRNVNHAVTVVGYGEENGVKYWIMRNSWGKQWGMNGYMKIKRGVNMCAIGHECTVPICSTDSAQLSPIPPPPPPSPSCDVSARYVITGLYNWTFRGVTTPIRCTNGICELRAGIMTGNFLCEQLCGSESPKCWDP